MLNPIDIDSFCYEDFEISSFLDKEGTRILQHFFCLNSEKEGELFPSREILANVLDDKKPNDDKGIWMRYVMHTSLKIQVTMLFGSFLLMNPIFDLNLRLI
jgi:hypothetical protein